MEQEVNRKPGKLAQLYPYRDKLVAAIEDLEKKRDKLSAAISEKTLKLEGVNKQIGYIENRQVYISTHFLLRWQERVCPEDHEEDIRRKLLTTQFINIIDTLGDGVYPYEQYNIVVNDRKLVTVIDPTVPKSEEL